MGSGKRYGTGFCGGNPFETGCPPGPFPNSFVFLPPHTLLARDSRATDQSYCQELKLTAMGHATAETPGPGKDTALLPEHIAGHVECDGDDIEDAADDKLAED